jgi:hypothetical protein
MRERHRLAIVSVLMLVALFFGVQDLVAQPPPPTLPGMPDQAPIDGGLGLLAAGGAAYAWKKLRWTRDGGRGTTEGGEA